MQSDTCVAEQATKDWNNILMTRKSTSTLTYLQQPLKWLEKWHLGSIISITVISLRPSEFFFPVGDAWDSSSRKALAHSCMITTAFNWSGILGIQHEACGCVCGSRLPSAGRLFFGGHNQSPNQGPNAPAPGSPPLWRELKWLGFQSQEDSQSAAFWVPLDAGDRMLTRWTH